MSYTLEYQRLDSVHLLIALPAGLPSPPRQGDTFVTQLSWFVGPQPPSSFAQLSFGPLPPDGQHLQHSYSSWTFVILDTRYFIRRLTADEPTLEPETWTVKVTRLPIGGAIGSASAAAEAAEVQSASPAPPTSSSSFVASAARREMHERLRQRRRDPFATPPPRRAPRIPSSTCDHPAPQASQPSTTEVSSRSAAPSGFHGAGVVAEGEPAAPIVGSTSKKQRT